MRSIITPILCLGLLLVFPAAAQQDEGGATPDAPQNLEGGGEPKSADTIPVDGGDESPPEDDDDAVSYSGIGLTRVSTDFDNLKEAINLGGVIGIRVPTVNWIAAEINIDVTMIPGENTGPRDPGTPNVCPPPPTPQPPGCQGTPAQQGTFTQSRNDLQMQNVGVFLVARSPGKYYATGKYGYRFINISIEEIQDGGDQSGSAYGAGVGYRWGKSLSGVELLYTKYSEQLDYLGFNIAYGFGAKRDRY